MKPEFHRKVLENGMTILFEKRNVPVVSVAFAVRQGGINETAEEKGISHFIEHLLYKGTPSRTAKQVAEEIEKKGGELNGFTDEEITAFWCKMPSKHLQTALDVLSDIVKNPNLDEKEIEKERKVIFEEMKLYKDNPRLYVFEEIHKSLFEAPFGIPVIGTEESMNSIDRNKMKEKFDEVYQPNNMILCVVGDANFDELVKFAEENFKGGKGKINQIEIVKKNEVKEEERKGIDQANIIFAYHSPLAEDEKSSAAEVLSALMAEGLSSRLFAEIREKRNLAYGVKGGAVVRKDYAYNYIFVGTMRQNVEKVKELILKELKDVSENLSEEEIAQVREQVIGNYQISLEESKSVMASLLYHEVMGNAKEFYEVEEKIKNVKLEDVKELAANAVEKYSFFALLPAEKKN